MRWWSKERRPTSCGEMQVQGLPGAPDKNPALGFRAGFFAVAYAPGLRRSATAHDASPTAPATPNTAGQAPTFLASG